mmetsp:Transcript_2229/g.5011  ORF Transcript_2229/g.5011 Transcript_2229/m.5011 type:complete len:227 (+) Transcript_2229:729-1409(+)
MARQPVAPLLLCVAAARPAWSAAVARRGCQRLEGSLGGALQRHAPAPRLTEAIVRLHLAARALRRRRREAGRGGAACGLARTPRSECELRLGRSRDGPPAHGRRARFARLAGIEEAFGCGRRRGRSNRVLRGRANRRLVAVRASAPSQPRTGRLARAARFVLAGFPRRAPFGDRCRRQRGTLPLSPAQAQPGGRRVNAAQRRACGRRACGLKAARQACASPARPRC